MYMGTQMEGIISVLCCLAHLSTSAPIARLLMSSFSDDKQVVLTTVPNKI